MAPTAVVRRPLAEAHELVAAEDVVARQPSPPYRVAAMDGIAGARRRGRRRPGDVLGRAVRPRRHRRGDQADWDAVVPVEDVERPDGVVVRAAAALRPARATGGRGRAGGDRGGRRRRAPRALRAGAGRVVRPRGARRCGRGRGWPSCRRATSCGPPARRWAPGRPRSRNGVMLAALVRAAGGEPTLLPLERDDPDAIGRAVEAAGGCERRRCSPARRAANVTTPGGCWASSAVDGVALRPGHPVILGRRGRRR